MIPWILQYCLETGFFIEEWGAWAMPSYTVIWLLQFGLLTRTHDGLEVENHEVENTKVTVPFT